VVDPGVTGVPAWHAGEKGDAADRVRDAGKTGSVAVGAGLAIAGDAQHDQAGIDLAQHLPAESPFFEGAGPEVLAQHVRLLDQFLEQFDAFGQVQVDGHRFLVACFAEPGQGVLALGRRAEVTHRVAADRVLDLQYLGAKFAQDGGAVGRGDHRRGIDDADAGKWQPGLGLISGGHGSTRDGPFR
jgi:hypothetical protein